MKEERNWCTVSTVRVSLLGDGTPSVLPQDVSRPTVKRFSSLTLFGGSEEKSTSFGGFSVVFVFLFKHFPHLGLWVRCAPSGKTVQDVQKYFVLTSFITS